MYIDLYAFVLSLDFSRTSDWYESAVPHKLYQLRGGKEVQVVCDDMYLYSVA